jgi:hypothetical protein
VIPAIAIVITTGSQINPKNALGNPSSDDCQERPTLLQEIYAEILHESDAFLSAANFTASIDRTSDAMRLRMLEMSIST